MTPATVRAIPIPSSKEQMLLKELEKVKVTVSKVKKETSERLKFL